MNRFAGMGSRLVEHFGSETLTLLTYQATEYGADGLAVAAEPEEQEIFCSVWPASAEERQQLPEGLQSRESLRVATTAALTVGRQAGAPPQRLVYRGEQWELHAVEHWESSSLSLATAVRVAS